MGQVCSGEKEEAKKPGAFQGPDDLLDDALSDSPHHSNEHRHQLQPHHDDEMMDPHNHPEMTRSSSEEGERLKKLREEQARLDMIVTAAGRGMVAVRSTRGSTGYYDQGFAAALAQHLEQTTQFPDSLPVRLPTQSEDSLYNRLSQPFDLPIKVGENSHRYIDDVAETLLDSVVPGKQQHFARVHPIVESLL
jgi:hypothetical protein